jgi:CheY-like chemotaxis protein/glycine cleavage system H lipoate-binding protein
MNGRKILVVDDELPVLKSIAKALSRDNYQVAQALSGEEALSLVRDGEFDAAVTDLMMPSMSGMELLRRLKLLRPEMPLIMITGYPSVRAAVESIKAGAFDYLPKPFTPEELRGQVARALARKMLDAGRIPRAGFQGYCIPENAWLEVLEDGNLRIGAHPVLLGTIGRITSIDFPDLGEMRYQGEPCAKLSDEHGRLHTLWAPASGKIIEVNMPLTTNIDLIIGDPYGRGWIMMMTPVSLADDIQNLLPLS